MFSHVGDSATGIQEISCIASDAEVTVYNVNGSIVANGRGQAAVETLAKGLYIIKVKTGDQVNTYRVTRK